MQHLVDELETLKTKVYKLESHTGEAVEVQPKGQEELTCIHFKLKAMAATMSSQQKVLEINEKANRVKNIIIVGLQEEHEKENIVEKYSASSITGWNLRISLLLRPRDLVSLGETCSITPVPS